MKIISLGRVDKKLLFVVAIIIINIIKLVVPMEVNPEYSNNLLCSFAEDLGPLIAGIILHFIFKNKKQKIKESKKSFKYIIILFLLRGVKICYEEIYDYFIIEDKYNYDYILITVNGVEIILITIGATIILKHQYYAHHKISMVIYLILAIVSDLILKNYFILNYKYIYILIIYIFAEIMVYIYLKYMMDKLYYHYAELVLYWGIIGIIAKIIIYGSILLKEYIKEDNITLEEFLDYFKNVNVAIIIFYQGLFFISIWGIYIVLIIVMIFYLQPNHMIIGDEFLAYANTFIYGKNPKRFYAFIPFAFQIFMLLFYFEILEINVCNLDKNTKKNIEKREETEAERALRISEMSKIEIGNQYVSLNNEQDNQSENNNELIDKNENNNELIDKNENNN